MKTFSFLIAFLLVGLFLFTFVDDARAGVICGTYEPVGACVACCKIEFGAANEKDFSTCEGLQGVLKKECHTFINILSKCAYLQCMEEECAAVIETPEESVICEILDQECNGD